MMTGLLMWNIHFKALVIQRSLPFISHCFWHTFNENIWTEIAPISFCRGLIVLNSDDTYYLEPITGQEILHHTFYRTEDLSIKTGTCGHSHQTGHLSLFSGHLKPLHQRVSQKWNHFDLWVCLPCHHIIYVNVDIYRVHFIKTDVMQKSLFNQSFPQVTKVSFSKAALTSLYLHFVLWSLGK